MSKKSSRQPRQDPRAAPAILSRKRKSESIEDYFEKEPKMNRSRQPCHEQNRDSSDEEKLCFKSMSRNSSSSSSPSESSKSFLIEHVTSSMKKFRPRAPICSPVHWRGSPLPAFSWADPSDVWNLLCEKDARLGSARDACVLGKHPSLQAKMRAILLDWLIEVCEVYRLHRETFYLAVDYLDRYLATQTDIPKQQLQLIGITCLFIAAKIEEIYPPKLSEFAYVTDGACTEAEVLKKELVIMKSLNWDLSPVTVNNWLNIYLQVECGVRSTSSAQFSSSEDQKENVGPTRNSQGTTSAVELRQYSGVLFVQAAQLVDLCIMDINSLQFPYSLLATAALYHTAGPKSALSATGFTWEDISDCVHWMTPYALTLKESGLAELRTFPQIPLEDSHNIQTHTVSLHLLETAHERASMMDDRHSPILAHGMLTPPKSKNKEESSRTFCPVQEEDDD